MGQEKLWAEEYRKKGIPSSFRSTPSGSVVWFHRFLKKHGKTNGRVLDMGCGKGRNSIYFAKKGFEVCSIDFVPEIISGLNNNAKEKNLNIEAICQSVAEKLPFPDNHFDFAIDVFCYPHIDSKEKQKFYRKEVYRVLKDDGYYLLSLAADTDSFYSAFLKNSPNPKNKMIIDPFAKVSKYLYSRKDAEKEFSPGFKVIDFQEKNKKDFMHGRDYARTTLTFAMQKK